MHPADSGSHKSMHMFQQTGYCEDPSLGGGGGGVDNIPC